MTETFLFRIQTDPNASASPTATAFFQTKTTVGGVDFISPQMQAVTWPLNESGKTVAVNGKTLTYAEVSAAVVAIAYAEKDAQP